MKIKFPYGTTAENDRLILPSGQLSVDVERKAMRLHDGLTVGGVEAMARQRYFKAVEAGDADWEYLGNKLTSANNTGMVYYKGYFYTARTNTTSLYRSNDGVTWAPVAVNGLTANISGGIPLAVVGNYLCVIAASGRQLAYSTDGLNWSMRSDPDSGAGATFAGVFSIGTTGYIIRNCNIAGQYAKVYRFTNPGDVNSWLTTQLYQVTDSTDFTNYRGGDSVAGRQFFHRSGENHLRVVDSAGSWTTHAFPGVTNYAAVRDVVHYNGLWYVFADSAIVRMSSSLTNKVQLNIPALSGKAIMSSAVSDDRVVLTTGDRKLFVTADMSVFTEKPYGVSETIRSMAFGSNMFIGTGSWQLEVIRSKYQPAYTVS